MGIEEHKTGFLNNKHVSVNIGAEMMRQTHHFKLGADGQMLREFAKPQQSIEQVPRNFLRR